MPWIRSIPRSEADPELQDVYERIAGERGKLSNIMAVQSLNPGAMDAHMDLYMRIMFGTGRLSREEREMIAVVDSSLNRCPYCVAHHEEALRHYWKDEETLEQFRVGGEIPGLSDRQRALLDYARVLTSEPDSVAETHVEELRAAGLEDAEILSANLIVAYFNFVNRIALGLGVETSAEEVSGYKY